MSIDYIVASLPPIAFGEPAPMTWSAFAAACGGEESATFRRVTKTIGEGEWRDIEVQLRNAAAEARTGGRAHSRAAEGCSLYWRDRIVQCFAEKDVAKRDEALDKAWWDAAGELVPPASPLGAGALAAYAVRLRIALRRSAISSESGSAAFEKLTTETKMDFPK